MKVIDVVFKGRSLAQLGLYVAVYTLSTLDQLICLSQALIPVC